MRRKMLPISEDKQNKLCVKSPGHNFGEDT